MKLLIQLLLTSVLFCEVTKTLRVPPSPGVDLKRSASQDVRQRVYRPAGSSDLVRVKYAPNRWVTRDARELCRSGCRRRHRSRSGSGPAPGAAPIVTVAELAVEAHRNALAIPTRARCFAFMFMVPCQLAQRQATLRYNEAQGISVSNKIARLADNFLVPVSDGRHTIQHKKAPSRARSLPVAGHAGRAAAVFLRRARNVTRPRPAVNSGNAAGSGTKHSQPIAASSALHGGVRLTGPRCSKKIVQASVRRTSG